MAWNVVVIDDRCRFPLHVWRYISRSLGFGIGDVNPLGVVLKRQGLSSEVWISENEPLTTEDGEVKLWWVRAGDHWQRDIGVITSQFQPGERLLFLVDIHGERDSKYKAEKVCAELDKMHGRDSWRPISAYYSGNKILHQEVLPKTRETLLKIRREIYAYPKPATFKDSSKMRHVLVTGAGFEISASRGGFGVPNTRRLLEEMEDPFYRGADPRGSIICLNPGESFPIPSGSLWDVKDFHNDISRVASRGDLDAYWNVLLEVELRREVETSATNDDRDSQKARAIVLETRMREAFRRSLLRYDWGHMKQTISAARLGWHAWLTTNYTQFANRAIAVSRNDGDNHGELGFWRVIATAAEAHVTLREHAGNTEYPPNRYLFKLHGDIGHLHTMAIAGHDKDIFSPLSMPVEDLYQVYATAQNFLLDSLSKAAHVMWHIVGHGLQDKRLCDLIGRVSQYESPSQLFILIDPKPDEPSERLAKAVKREPSEIGKCKLCAAEYMARLESRGLPDSRDAAENWAQEMAAPKP
jgi:hypothetical protein